MVARDWFRSEGQPHPLGATWVPDEQAFNFALYSRHATAVTLLLYRADDLVTPRRKITLAPRINRTGRVWHTRLASSALDGAQYYAYSVDGSRDEAGQRFAPDKILLDPYARHVFLPPNFDRGAAVRPGSNAGRAPLGQIPEPGVVFDWGDDKRPRHTSDLVIYELHVRGFTRDPSSNVAPAKRGTYAGVIEKIPYLKSLGVTAVELLPVYQYAEEPGGNYWGYMPLGFFAPHARYGAATALLDVADEFRSMVKALRQANIEVILDVVYNHTAEQGEDGPTYAFRGIDNSTYYLLTPDLHHYRDDCGTGNTLRTSHPAVRQLVMDSLRFWAKEMRVDGFRFDLASVLSRNDEGDLSANAPLLSEIASDPDLADRRLIAEPWDMGAYQLGRAFPCVTWMQWNGRFRDDVRCFVIGDAGLVPALIQRLCGSNDIFPDALAATYRPFQSVNFVTCHDGFCLYDLVSYGSKHNHGNGFANTDGNTDNHSWNCGLEGDEHVPPDVMALRRRQVKNFCALLMLANGTPMLVAGDEFLRTQRGNNNPYNQDNETSWLDWKKLEDNADVFRFWQRMIEFRKAHPTLGRSHFWREAITWYGADGPIDLSDDSRSVAFLLDGSEEDDVDLFVIANAYWLPISFALPLDPARPWRRALDTSLPPPSDFSEPMEVPVLGGSRYPTGPRSVVVLIR